MWGFRFGCKKMRVYKIVHGVVEMQDVIGLGLFSFVTGSLTFERCSEQNKFFRRGVFRCLDRVAPGDSLLFVSGACAHGLDNYVGGIKFVCGLLLRVIFAPSTKDGYRTKSVTTLSLFQSLSQDFLAVMAP